MAGILADIELVQIFKEFLPDLEITVQSQIIEEYSSATFKHNSFIKAIISPKDKLQLQECVKLANKYRIALFPISKGKNWGYGSKQPQADNCVIVSLDKLNKITDFNEDLRYIRVEPGVTFAKVANFLNQRNSSLIPPSIGSTPEASLIGNAMERGIGKGIYGDRFLHSCNLEVILANGEFINTGFGNFENSNSANLFKSGLGPMLDGIFSQSNFGIVTQMTFWLVKKPNYFQTFFYTIRNNEDLTLVINALRLLRAEGTLNCTSTISNDYRVLSMQQQYPHHKERSSLKDYFSNELDKVIKGSRWVGDDAIMSANKRIGKAKAKRVKELLNPLTKELIFIDDNSAKLYKLIAKPIKWFFDFDIKKLLYFHNNSLYLGKEMTQQLSICYWRKNIPVPAQIDPDKDKCGVIWCSPTIPFDGEHVNRVLNLLMTIYKKYGFEPNIGLNLMSERVIACTACILFDRQIEGEDKKALDCYNSMLDILTQNGYPPYRLGIQSMKKMLGNQDAYKEFINKIKNSIDPSNIISPFHYVISPLVQ